MQKPQNHLKTKNYHPFILNRKIEWQIGKNNWIKPYSNKEVYSNFKQKLKAYNEMIYSPLNQFKIPDFLNIQRSSFREFLKSGLIAEFQKYNSIANSNQTLEVFFYAEHYKLNRPKWTPKQAILKKKSYSCQLYLPIQLSNYQTEEVHLQWVLLANLPLMTKNGHFILNGCPRVLMNQIVRSPGVYFRKVTKNQKIVYSADFIAQRGSWLRLEVDTKKGDIWAKLKKTPKIPIFTFLRALGLTLPILNNSIDFGKLRYLLQFKEESKRSKKVKEFLGPGINNSLDIVEFRSLLKSLKKYMKPKPPKKPSKKQKTKKTKKWLTPFLCSTYFQSLLELCQKLYPQKKFLELDPKLAQKFLFRKFQNPRTYDLSLLGRAKINKKLGLSIPLENTILTSQDVLFSCLFLMDLMQGLVISDDIDDLKNRKIKPSGELIQTQLSNGLIRLEKSIREKLKHSKQDSESFSNLFTVKPLNQSFREFFGTNPLSQLMDQTNALSEITHKRRLSSLGPGGINRETAGMAIRGIHPTHYGRICPIETPEGQNAGLVNSFTILSHLNTKSFIETPFYKTYKGFILKNKNPFLFSSDQERSLILAPGDIQTSFFNFLPSGVPIPSRQFKEFKKVSRNEINFIAVSPIQMISIATSLIPFLEHNDGNRALMGSNMQRQAVPTLRPAKPIVGTGLESRVISDVGHGLQVKKSGFVSYVDGNKIIIYSKKITDQNFFFNNKKSDFQKKNSLFLNFYSRQKKTSRSSFKKKLVNCANILNFKGEETFSYGKAKARDVTQIKNKKQKVYSLAFDWLRKAKVEGNFNSRDFLAFGNYLTSPNVKTNKKGFSNSFLKKRNKYNFLNYSKIAQPNFYSDFSILPFQLKNKENYFNNKQLSCLSNSLFLNDFLGQFQLLKFFSKKVFYSKLTSNFKPFLSKRSLFLINKFSHQKLLFSYCKIILIHFYMKLNNNNTKKFTLNLNTSSKLLKRKFILPTDKLCLSAKQGPKDIFSKSRTLAFALRAKVSSKNQIANPFWYNSFPLFLSKSSPLTPVLFRRSFIPTLFKTLQLQSKYHSRTGKTNYGNDQKFSSNQNLQKRTLILVKPQKFTLKNQKKVFLLQNKAKPEPRFQKGKIMTNKFYLKLSRLLKLQKKNSSNFQKELLKSEGRKMVPLAFALRAKVENTNLTKSQQAFLRLKKLAFPHFSNSQSFNLTLSFGNTFASSFPYPFFNLTSQNSLKQRLVLFKNPFLFWAFTSILSSLKNFDFYRHQPNNKSSFLEEVKSQNVTPLKSNNVKKKFEIVYNENKSKYFQNMNKNFFLPLLCCRPRFGVKQNRYLNFSFNSLLFEITYPVVGKTSNLIETNLTRQELKQNSKGFITNLLKRKPFFEKFAFPFCPICLKLKTFNSIKNSGKVSNKSLKFCFCFSVKKSQMLKAFVGLKSADKNHNLKAVDNIDFTFDLRSYLKARAENFKSGSHLQKQGRDPILNPQTGNKGSNDFLSIKSTDVEDNVNQEKQRFELYNSRSLLNNNLISQNYTLNKYHRSNQDTYLIHRPIVQEGQWVEKGDILADSSVSVQGELSIGQNILVGYIPWEGYNFEDAVLISERLIFDDLYTSLHIERYEVEIRDTQFGLEQITNQIPNENDDYDYIDQNGIAKIGTWVKEGDILVGKIAPIGQKKLTAYENLLYDILNKEIPKTRDTSLRVPRGVTGRVIHVEVVETSQKKGTDHSVFSKPLKFPKKQKLKKAMSGENWPTFNIKNDQKVQTFFLKKKAEKFFSTQIQNDLKKENKMKSQKINPPFLSSLAFELRAKVKKTLPEKQSCRNSSFNVNRNRRSNKEMYFFTKNEKINLSTLQIKVEALEKKKFQFSKIVKARFYLLQKAQTTNFQKENFVEDKFDKNINSLNKNFYKNGFQYEKNNKADAAQLYHSLKNIKTKQSRPSLQKTSFSGPQKVHIYLAEKRKLQIGDKIAGRHGNKGIISNVLPRQDMPYLSDGTPLDIVLNPLGVPSRMNVGQIFECLLGMAGYYLKQNYKIQPFDEIYGCEASRSLVYSKLYEARIKTGQDWLFNPNHPGKTRLFDGRTGDCFKQPVTVGVAYILKLIHLVDDKIHARSTGPYSLVTQQPLRGRSKQGGQRVGEMEVWALEGFGAAYILQEILTIKSDDLKGRNQVINSILNNKPVNFGLPESFKVLVRELQSLCLDIAIYRYGENGIPTKININNFS